MQTDRWNQLVKQYQDKLAESGQALQALSATAYAETARAEYGGDGLPLGLVERDDMGGATLEDHLRDVELDLSATAEGIRCATEGGAAESADALALLCQYRGMLQETQVVLRQLVDLANQHGLSSTSVVVAEW
jgi:hypothetical protein